MTIHWGILGAGDIADRHMAPAIRLAHNHELVAVMCRTIEKARAFTQKHMVPRAFDEVEDLLSDNEVNAVYVATPPYLHAQNTVRAAECGKHVLCKKPMALNAAEARSMIDACRANHVGLMVCHYQRFNARHQRIKTLLEAGAIGTVTAIRSSFSDYYPAFAGNWRHNPSLGGGGPLFDLAPHCLDLLLYLCGPVLEVSAMTDILACDSPVEDTATLLLRLTNGAQAVVTTHWSTANFDGNAFSRIELCGTKGSIMAAPLHAKDSAGFIRLATSNGIEDHSLPPTAPRPHVALLEAFERALAAGTKMPVPGEDGLAGLEVIHAAYQSARSGARIRLSSQASRPST
jgi:1,5-anhydro-D-fructose reductase (1,5-anhydro-D-mannitol-forming)